MSLLSQKFGLLGKMLRKIPKTPIFGHFFQICRFFKFRERELCGQVPHLGTPLGALPVLIMRLCMKPDIENYVFEHELDINSQNPVTFTLFQLEYANLAPKGLPMFVPI